MKKDLKNSLQQIFEKCSPLLSPLEPIQSIYHKVPFVDTPLHLVSGWGDYESALTLLYNGADIDEQGDKRLTPIYRAISSGHLELVKLLIGLGAQLDKSNDLNTTPLQYALSIKSSPEIIEVLSSPKIVKRAILNFDQYEPKLRLTHANTLSEILSICASNYSFKKYPAINDKTADFKFSPLHLMASWGDLNAVNILIKNGAKLNAIDWRGSTAAFYSIIGQNSCVLDSLIEAGAKLDITNQAGQNFVEFLLNAYHNEKIINEFILSLVKHNIKFSKAVKNSIYDNKIERENVTATTLRLLNKLFN